MNVTWKSSGVEYDWFLFECNGSAEASNDRVDGALETVLCITDYTGTFVLLAGE